MPFKIVFGFVWMLFGTVLLDAQVDPLETYKVVAVSSLNKENGATYEIAKNGLVLSLNLPSRAKNLDSIVVNLSLINKTGVDLHYRFSTGLGGFDFGISKGPKEALPRTSNFESLRQGGIGVMTFVLKKGFAMERGFPLRAYCPVSKYGEYTISASWADTQFGGPGGFVRLSPEIEVKGKFLIKPSPEGVLISEIK